MVYIKGIVLTVVALKGVLEVGAFLGDKGDYVAHLIKLVSILKEETRPYTLFR